MAFRMALRASRSGMLRSGARGMPFVGSRAMSTFRYMESHEYVKMEGDVGVVGISDFAQSQLGDIVYVELPAEGDRFESGDVFGSVESVKAASDVYAPVSGKVVSVNSEITEKPEMINSHAMTDAWFIKMEVDDASQLDKLMDEKAYEKFVEEQS